VVLDLARRLAAMDPGPSCRSVLFVFFGAEEVGLQGSGYLVENSPIDLSRVDCMINFDTVGQMTGDKLHVSGVGTAQGLQELVQQANIGDLELSLARGGWSGSDHMSFNTREVPVLFVFGGPYPQYNTPADTWDSLDYPAMLKIADYSLALAALLRNHGEPLLWQMVGDGPLLDEGNKVEGNRSTWLGTLPDFTEDIQGYKLAGVFDNSPAARAGLQKGDILILLGGQPVVDLPTFTRALRSSAPGDLVEITLLRDGNRLNFTVVLGDRKDRQ
jgi:aminopeptidase YwaD